MGRKKVNEAATILIVDDELCVRQLLMHILKQEGYECITAADGNEALRKMEHESIPLIVSDIQIHL